MLIVKNLIVIMVEHMDHTTMLIGKKVRKQRKSILVSIVIRDNYNKYKDNIKTPLQPLPAIIIIK
jgi:hypothetical protein